MMANTWKYLLNKWCIMADETIERSFPVSARAYLKLGNIRGTVKIQPGDDDQITVSAVKHLDSGRAEDTLIEIKQDEEGRVIVKTRYSLDVFGGILNTRRPCKVDYDVRVPHACMLKISVVSSTALVQGISGEIDLKTVSGSMTIEDVSGELEISSVSGDVVGKVLAGPTLRINTVSGDVDLKQADFPAIEGKTVSGDLCFETPLGDGPYDFNSVSGDILLVVPPETRCTMKVRGISGRIKSMLPLTADQRRNSSHYAELMGGGVTVNLNTVSGDLILKDAQGSHVKTDNGLPSELNYTKPTHGEILEKIERGEISVDEGVQALRS
jgi:hypothetical protein